MLMVTVVHVCGFVFVFRVAVAVVFAIATEISSVRQCFRANSKICGKEECPTHSMVGTSLDLLH